MVQGIFYILTVALLLHIYFQDKRDRQVFLFSYLGLGLCLLVLQITTNPYWYINILTNLVLVASLLVGVTAYVSIKHGQLVNPLIHYLGIGDILFFSVLGLGFAPMSFIGFLTAGFIVLALVYGVKKHLFSQTVSTIPLAGDLALLLIPFLLIQFWMPNLFVL